MENYAPPFFSAYATIKSRTKSCAKRRRRDANVRCAGSSGPGGSLEVDWQSVRAFPLTYTNTKSRGKVVGGRERDTPSSSAIRAAMI
jgi:hypothetical protein